MNPSVNWAGGILGNLRELFSSAHPAGTLSAAALVLIITAAVILTMVIFAKQTPSARRDIIKLVEAVRRPTPKH